MTEISFVDYINSVWGAVTIIVGFVGYLIGSSVMGRTTYKVMEFTIQKTIEYFFDHAREEGEKVEAAQDVKQ